MSRVSRFQWFPSGATYHSNAWKRVPFCGVGVPSLIEVPIQNRQFVSFVLERGGELIEDLRRCFVPVFVALCIVISSELREKGGDGDGDLSFSI